MKRKILYFVLFLAGLMLFSGSAECKWYAQVEIDSAVIDYDNGIIYINGDNFGREPEVFLDDTPLNVIASGETYIDAEYPDFEPGTYWLMVKTRISRYHPKKSTGTLSMTIGTQGPKGDSGDQGEVGLKGDKGDKGDPGPVGPKGDKGDKGDPGPVGPKGDKGEKGERGADGDKGEKGDRGETGPKGDTGERGDKGDQGEPGISGYLQHSLPPSRIGIPAGQTLVFRITCPEDRAVLGGGGQISGCSTPCTIALGDSYPVSKNVWGLSYRNLGQDTKTFSITVHAVCADVKN